MSRLVHVPIGLREANAFVGIEHRHVGQVRGHKFSIGATLDGRLVGIAIVARTTAAGLANKKRTRTDKSESVARYRWELLEGVA